MLAPTPASPESVGMSKPALDRIDAHLKRQYIDAGRFPIKRTLNEWVGVEADIFADGTFHNWEQEIPASDLPQRVVQTVARQFPHANMKEIMAVTEVTGGDERLQGYEIVVQRAHKKDVEMTVAPDGKILEGPGKEK